MKKILTLLVMTLASWGILTAQTTPTPKFTYQAVVRHDGNLVRSQEIPTTINIYNGDALVYSETHTPTSTANGLVSILIGDGTVAEGSLTEVDWSGATLEAVFSVDDDQITSTMQVKPVPYAIQAANTELTTEQIVALVRDELTYDDVLDIVSAVAQNGTLAADLKDTVVNYLIAHKGLAKEVAEEYFSHATGDHVRQAYNALYANTPVKNKVKEILTNYLLNHPEMAKEVLTYYLTHADADDVNYAYTALTNMPADVKQAIKNRMIGYVQNHREIVY